MKDKNIISTQTSNIALSAASSLVGFAIGGPVGAVVGGTMSPTVKLAYQLVCSWNERRKIRITNVVEEAFVKSDKNEETILNELFSNQEWSDAFIAIIQQLAHTDPELDRVFPEIMALAIKANDSNERKRLLVLNNSIKGLNKIQIQIIRYIYRKGGKMSAHEISKAVNVPEIELRNAVRDLELRGMIIDNETEPTVWKLRELGVAIAKTIDVLEV